MKAIALVYVEDQNEPSQPDRKLHDIPRGDPATRDEFLLNLFAKLTGEDEGVTINITPSNFGDITVSHEEFGVHMYLTFIDNS
jgi:hypothetical protein